MATAFGEAQIGMKVIEVTALLLPLLVLILQLASRSEYVQTELEAKTAQMVVYVAWGLYFTGSFAIFAVLDTGVGQAAMVSLIGLFLVYLLLSSASVDLARALSERSQPQDSALHVVVLTLVSRERAKEAVSW